MENDKGNSMIASQCQDNALSSLKNTPLTVSLLTTSALWYRWRGARNGVHIYGFPEACLRASIV